MADQEDLGVFLYDAACTQNVCFDATVWRIRLMLNYKNIPYKTIFLELPQVESTLKGRGLPLWHSELSYIVPAICHLASNTFKMGFADIERFLESRYPGRPVTLTSELGREIEAKANDSVIKAFGTSLMPRTLRILSPQSREFLRWRHSPVTKDRFEDLLGAEEQVWSELEDGIHAVGELLQTHSADGKFVLGDSPSNTDFFIAGYLQSAKVIHEEVFNRIVAYPGYHDIYDACLPYMEKKD